MSLQVVYSFSLIPDFFLIAFMNQKLCLLGLRKVTADMKAKNRTDRTGIVGATEKETRASSQTFSKAGPPKLELQMGRK